MKTFVDAQIKHAPSNVKPRRAGRAINPLVTCAVIAFVGFLASIACAVPSFAQIVGTVQLNIERRGHTATLLEDGKVLIVGGDNQSGIVNQVELLDPASQTSSLAAMPIVARTDHTATRLADGRVLIIGGRDQNGSLTSTEIYNPLTATFTAGRSLTTPRGGHTATVLANGNILVAGGDASGSAELYNPTTQSFSLIAGSMNTARKFHSAILLNNGQVLIAGGVGAQNNVLNTAEVYDPSSQSFYVPPTDMQTPRALAMLKLLSDGKVQIIGGDAEFSMEVFDPTNGIFIAKALLPPNADLLGATLSTQSRAALFSPTISQDPLLQGVLTPEQLALLDRADHSITELPSRNQALVAGGIDSAGQILNSAKLVSSSKASVTTDKTDYAPGQIVTITGNGFQPNEQVHIYFHEFPEEYPDIFLSAVANQQGNFVVAEFAPQQIDLGRIFTLSAIGQTSGFTAQTAFKDATNIDTSTTLNTISSSLTAGQTGVAFSGTVSPNSSTDPPVPNGSPVQLTRYSSTACTGSGTNFASTTTTSGNGSFSGTFTAPAAGIYGVRAEFPQANQGGGSGTNWKKSDSGCQTITVNAGTALTITSSNNTTFTVGTAGSFTVTTTGSPTPALTKSGALPTGVTFIDNGNGTATLSGTPALGTVNSYPITITANNGVSPNATQNFTLTVQMATQATLTVNAPATLTYGNTTTLTASGGSGTGAVTFSAGASTGCAVAGDLLSVTNASGTCSITASKAADDNYNVANSPAAVVTLLKAGATINVTAYDGPYTATPHGATGTATGLLGADLNSLLHVATATYTDVPGGTVSWTFDGNTNYNSASGSVEVKIAKVNATINVTAYDGPYTATPHGATGTATGLLGVNLNSLLHVATTTYTDVPGGTVSWTFDGNTNYNSAFGDATVTITKATSTTTVTGGTFTYDGNPHRATVSVTGAGLNLTPAPSYSGCSAAPVYVYETTPTPCTASYTYAGDANHTGSSGSDTIIITTAFAFNGFYSPIGGSVENGNGGSYGNPLKTFKLGSTIPVKFGATWLTGGAPLITGIHTLQAVKYSNATDWDPPIDATPTDAATDGNSFRLTSTDWHFNLSTKDSRFSAGTWLLMVTLQDGSKHSVWITIKK